jgi:hypothetical protein
MQFFGKERGREREEREGEREREEEKEREIKGEGERDGKYSLVFLKKRTLLSGKSIK